MGIPGKTPGLWLLDFDLGPLHGDIFADILARILKNYLSAVEPPMALFFCQRICGGMPRQRDFLVSRYRPISMLSNGFLALGLTLAREM